MQEKESILAVRSELKILSLGITVRHNEANSYPRDGIFNPHLTTIKESYITVIAMPTCFVSAGCVSTSSIVDVTAS